MGKTKDRGRYQSISLHVEFIAVVKDFIKDKPQYRSIADFTREALREKIRRESNAKNSI